MNSGNHCRPSAPGRTARARAATRRRCPAAGPARRGRSRSGRCRRRRSRAGTRRGAWPVPPARLEPRAVEFSGHSFISCSLFRFWLLGHARAMLPAPARPRAASPRDSRPTTDAPPRRATAARLRRASPSPWRRAACFRSEGDARRLLHGEIAGRPGVGMAEAEQQIDVGGPRARCRAARSARHAPASASISATASRSMCLLAMALPISLIDLILGRDRPSRSSLSPRAPAARYRGGTDRTPRTAGRGSPRRWRSRAAGRRRWRTGPA